MPVIAYKRFNFRDSSLKTITLVNRIIREYVSQGYDLTLRQVYYQMVARGYIPNKQTEYNNLGSIINDARLAGYIDWNHITDRTRNLRGLGHWDDPQDIIEASAQSFQIDKWEGQDNRVEVWVEKDALVGVIQRVCDRLDLPYFSCRGYTSQSEMWAASQRLLGYNEQGQTPIIIHLGDHDPSGIDMTRDIDDRLAMFMGGVEIQRVALNMNQVEEYKPPPNPAKITDSRYAKYMSRYGRESWELDALEPQVISDAIERTVLDFRDQDVWDKRVAEEREHIKGLKLAADRWEDVQTFLNGDQA